MSMEEFSELVTVMISPEDSTLMKVLPLQAVRATQKTSLHRLEP